MMPAGAAKKESLGNDLTIVEYKGPTPPMLVQANPTGAETFNFMNQLKEEFQQIYGAYGVSRGEPPAGVTAGIALQWLSEQESERYNEQVLKWNEAVRQLVIMTISVCGTYYDDSDQRMIRVLGKNQSWMSEFFDASNLSKDYDVRVQNTSSQAESKAFKKLSITELAKQFPDIVTPEQVLDAFDLANDEKFVNAATTNLRTAEAENERLLSDKYQEAEVDISDDHVMHWQTHIKKLQEWAVKYSTQAEMREHLIDHVRAHEMFMVEFAQKNPQFGQALGTLPGFPLYFSVPTPEEEPTPEPQEKIKTGADLLAEVEQEQSMSTRPGAGAQGGASAPIKTGADLLAEVEAEQQLVNQPPPSMENQLPGENIQQGGERNMPPVPNIPVTRSV